MGFRYIGSKEKLSDLIISEIQKINPKARYIIDLMAGTGLFSKKLRQHNYKVLAIDIMTYSYHHLMVHLKLNNEPPFTILSTKLKSSENELFKISNYSEILSHLNNLQPIKGYFYNEFSPEGNPKDSTKPRKYFSANNAAKIDAIRDEIISFKKESLISELEHSLLIHDLIMAVNDIANIAGTYGHYLSNFVARAKSPIVMKPTVFSGDKNIRGHKIYNTYAEKISSNLKADLCYIDPPYLKRQYAANYHILETIACEDFPKAIGESGLRPWRNKYSNFCSKVKIKESFHKILNDLNVKDFLISYSEDGLLKIDDLVSFCSNYGSTTIKEIKYKRFKSSNHKNDKFLTEYLIHIRKN